MLRRLAAIASLALLGALSLGVAGAHALIAPPGNWDVSIAGKQTVKWSFDAEIPAACTSYYGTTSQTAKGSGTVSMTFASKKPIPARTYLANNGLRFSSFSTGGSYTAPAAFTKQGKFAVIVGRPCNWVDGDPEPLSKIAPDEDCGTVRQKADVSLAWDAGKFTLGAGIGMLPWGNCPGVVQSDTRVLSTAGCLPEGEEDAIEGEGLVGMPAAVPASEFTARKKFSVDASKEYHCDFASTWPGAAPLKIDLSASYRVTFKPTR